MYFQEKVQSVSTSESSFNKSDEFFTPNPELVSRYSETSTNGNYTENQFTKEVKCIYFPAFIDTRVAKRASLLFLTFK